MVGMVVRGGDGGGGGVVVTWTADLSPTPTDHPEFK